VTAVHQECLMLDYALLTAPTPLQAGMPAILTLTISNGGRQLVTVTQIVITLPIGTNAKDLTASTGFQSGATPGWNAGQNGGVITLTPTGSGVVTKDAVVVTIANVAVNDQPGTTNLFIDETAAVGGGAPVTSSTSVPVGKFPAQFSLSPLVATPTEVAFGGSTSLMWTGTNADGATYALDYPGAPQHPIPVTNVGPYQASNLTIFPTTFTLTVSLTVPGQDQPVIVQQQATVDKIPQVAITQFVGSQTVMAGADPPLTLQWQVQMADSVTLSLQDLPGAVVVTNVTGCTVTANGTVPFVISDPSGNQLGTLTPPNPIPEFVTFVLTASGGNLVDQRPFQIQILTPAQITGFSSNETINFNCGFQQKVWTLSWSTANANPVTITNIGTVGASGSQQINPGQTYTILALGFGTQATQPLFVNG
jgi:hypothetical protein